MHHRLMWCVAGLVLALSGSPAAQDAPKTEFQKLEALVASYTAERRAITGAASPEPGALTVDRGPRGTQEQARPKHCVW